MVSKRVAFKHNWEKPDGNLNFDEPDQKYIKKLEEIFIMRKLMATNYHSISEQKIAINYTTIAETFR